MSSKWNIGSMLSWMTGYLEDHGIQDALISTRWLISDATGLSQMGLYTSLDRELSDQELDLLRTNVKKRADGMPLQYITGRTTFRFIDIFVDPDVLIPRPETEVLVSEVLSRLPRDKHVSETVVDVSDIKVLEPCTGSGCIAASLAYENPRIEVVATDISPNCAELARKNVQELGLESRVKVIECDLAEGLDEDAVGAFDAVVSNPPYIPTSDLSSLPREVSDYEPALALDGGLDGLDIYRRLLDISDAVLKPGGFLACELHEKTLEQASDLAKERGYSQVQIAEDLNRLPRIIIAVKGK